jgi:hypothetical protein
MSGDAPQEWPQQSETILRNMENLGLMKFRRRSSKVGIKPVYPNQIHLHILNGRLSHS